MPLHHTTFEYLKPTEQQVEAMAELREGFKTLSVLLDSRIPEGPDKTYVLRKLRSCAMWANVALTRNSDGSPKVNFDMT